MSSSEIRIKKLIGFNYTKKDVTENRLLYVTEEKAGLVRGICADKKQWRAFKREKMHDVALVGKHLGNLKVGDIL